MKFLSIGGNECSLACARIVKLRVNSFEAEFVGPGRYDATAIRSYSYWAFTILRLLQAYGKRGDSQISLGRNRKVELRRTAVATCIVHIRNSCRRDSRCEPSIDTAGFHAKKFSALKHDTYPFEDHAGLRAGTGRSIICTHSSSAPNHSADQIILQRCKWKASCCV